MNRPLLITGFEPFAGLSYNPSAAVLERLPEQVGGCPVRTAVLPVDTTRLPAALHALYELQPLLVLHTGLALQRATLTVERQGINRLDFDRRDNGGHLIQGQPIIAAAPAALPVRLPVDPILEALAQGGIPAAASDSAGAFLCNQALFHSLHHLPASVAVGFVHLAPDERLAALLGGPAQPLQQQADALRIILELVASEFVRCDR